MSKYNYRHWGDTKRQTVYAGEDRMYLQGLDFDKKLTKIEVYPEEIDSLIEALWQLRSVR